MSKKTPVDLEAFLGSAAGPPAQNSLGHAAKRTGRAGKTMVAAYVPESWSLQLEEIVLAERKRGRKITKEALVMEGLNLVYEKYGQPKLLI